MCLSKPGGAKHQYATRLFRLKGLGKIATVLVQSGTLSCGDDMIAGTATGRVKVMIDDKGKQVKKAGPSTPVSVTGWDELPEAGDIMDVVESDRFARDLSANGGTILFVGTKKQATDAIRDEALRCPPTRRTRTRGFYRVS